MERQAMFNLLHQKNWIKIFKYFKPVTQMSTQITIQLSEKILVSNI